MDKNKLVGFINKYHLGGEIKSTKIESNGKSLTTRFISGDKSVVGSVKMDKFDAFDPSEIGVYNTSQLLSLLSVVGDDVDFTIDNMGGQFVSLQMKDSGHGTTSKYMLSDLSVIPTPPPLKNLPSEFELELKLDSYFIGTFINGKGALPETETFTIIADNDKVNIVIGFSNIASNRVTIPVSVDNYSDIEPISFSAEMFSSILSANKECQNATMKVSSAGLSKINFSIDDYESEYYLVSTQSNT